MTTLSIGKAQQAIGAYIHQRSHRRSMVATQQGAGALPRFASAIPSWADKYAEYKYNHRDWRMFSHRA